MTSLCKQKCGCKQIEKEMFCSSCFHNFNADESFYEWNAIHLCPLCHPENDLNERIDRLENR